MQEGNQLAISCSMVTLKDELISGKVVEFLGVGMYEDVPPALFAVIFLRPCNLKVKWAQ